MKFLNILFSILFISSISFTQENHFSDFKGSPEKQLVFHAHPSQKFGFDDFRLKTWDEQSNVLNGENEFSYIIPVKSIATEEADLVLVSIIGDFDSSQTIQFELKNETRLLNYKWVNDSLIELEIPENNLNYTILAKHNNEIFGSLDVIIYAVKKYNLTLIPTFNFPISVDLLNLELNKIYQGANILFNLRLAPKFETKEFNDSTIYDYPEDSRMREYTDQMFRLNNNYELKFKPAGNSEYKLFVISTFRDSLSVGYMGIGNQTGYIIEGNEKEMAEYIALQLARGIGYVKQYKKQFTSDTITDLILSHADWEQMRSGEAANIHWVEATKVKRIGAVTAYYFWEEAKDGTIIENSILRPYKKNLAIIATDKNKRESLSSNKLSYAVNKLMDEKEVSQKANFEIKQSNGFIEKIHIPLKKSYTQELGSIVFRKRNGIWESNQWKNVIYFNIFKDSIRKFSHANDSLILSKYNIKLFANGHYIVKTYWKNDGKIDKQEVYAYNGENVTKFFLEPEKIIPKRVLVFSNGYRGPDKEKDVSDNVVTNNDRYYYWMGIDKEFIKRLDPFQTYYIDGNHSISTSSHKNMINFSLSIAAVKTFAPKDYYNILNSKPNEEGFNERREKGKIAGKSFLTAKCNSPACLETIDTVDIVCHSMGYAYALGFIDAIQNKVVFGKMYILAPENACIGGTNWKMFEEVWQYGSNLDQPNPDPVWEQDGIAPQCQVKGLEQMIPARGGRAFIPKDWPLKNFIDSHMLYNFTWIFETIKSNEPGYIKPKK